jgi:NHL repeat
VSTIAGTAGNFGGADGTGTAASFQSPYGLAFDLGGNLIVADGYNHCIRKVTTAGVVTTFAGMASASGAYLDSATAANAKFNTPYGVAVDAAGNVYVADTNNNVIRKIDTGGVVTTPAGVSGFLGGYVDGPGATAKFSFPIGIMADASGIYVADSFNSVIRKISGTTVSTYAGAVAQRGTTDGNGAAARFNMTVSGNPYGMITLDNLGNVFVADAGNHTIRRITPAGDVTTVAGTAGVSGTTPGTGTAALFYNPVNVTLDSSGSTFYVSNWGTHAIQKMSATYVTTNFAGTPGFSNSGPTDGNGLAAKFRFPAASALDAAGNLYLADQGNHVIRKIAPNGDVTTFAGTAPVPSSPTGSFADGTGAAARFNAPRGIVVSASGIIYVADTSNNCIRRIDSASGAVTTIAGTPGTASFADGTGSAALFNRPWALCFDRDGNLLVADQNNNAIRKVTLAGVVTTVVGSPTRVAVKLGDLGSAAISAPSGVAYKDGKIYIATRSGVVVATGF